MQLSTSAQLAAESGTKKAAGGRRRSCSRIATQTQSSGTTGGGVSYFRPTTRGGSNRVQLLCHKAGVLIWDPGGGTFGCGVSSRRAAATAFHLAAKRRAAVALIVVEMLLGTYTHNVPLVC